MTANDWHKSLSDISEFSLARYPKTVLKKKKKKTLDVFHQEGTGKQFGKINAQATKAFYPKEV